MTYLLPVAHRFQASPMFRQGVEFFVSRPLPPMNCRSSTRIHPWLLSLVLTGYDEVRSICVDEIRTTVSGLVGQTCHRVAIGEPWVDRRRDPIGLSVLASTTSNLYSIP